MSGVAPQPLYPPALWRDLRQLIARLEPMSPPERGRELERVAAVDAALAGAARALLAEDGDTPAATVWDALDRLMKPSDDPPATFAGFRLLDKIGVGGMGVVYLAERRSGDVTRRVALKLLDGGANGFARLAARERRILAALAHPNITAFVDAGSSDGRAWLAMEYVDGVPLIAHCDAARLDVRARIGLFDQVCAAVAHAHAQLVVHRDLKPSNVLVTRDGVVKLLDFGIALVLDPGEEQGTATHVFTPGYAAPEQLRGERVTTATDIHALGLLLFELVTGQRLPTGARSDADAEWTTAELARLATAARDGTAEPRRDDGKAIASMLRGDLGRIIAHAVAPQPTQRYASAVLLRDDLRRWLERRPLTIARRTFGYVAVRFASRHRAAVAIGTFALVALLSISAVALWQARVAAEQAQRAAAVKNFLLDIFKRNSTADPEGAKARQTTAEQLLELGAARIRSELKDVPEVRAELLGTMGQLYLDLALDDRSIPLFQEQIRILREIGDDAALPAVQVALGSALADAGKPDESTAVLRAALAALDARNDVSSTLRVQALCYLGRNAYRSLPADDPTARREYTEALRILDAYHPGDALRVNAVLGLAQAEEYAENFDAAEQHYRRALGYALAASGDGKPMDVAGVYQQLGSLLRKRKQFDASEKFLRSAVTTFTRAAGADSPWTASAQQDLAMVLADTGRRGDAEALLQTALQTMQRARGADDPELVASLRLALGGLQVVRGEPERAAETLKACLDSTTENSNSHVIALARYAQVLLDQGKLGDAAGVIDQALAAIGTLYGPTSGTYARALLLRGQLWFAHGDDARAHEVFDGVITAWSASGKALSPQLVQATALQMQLDVRSGRAAAAVARGESLLARIEALPPEQALSVDEAQIRLWLGEARRRDGHPQRAVTDLRRAVALRETLDDATSPQLARARISLAECLLDLHETAAAAALIQSAAAALAGNVSRAEQFTQALAAAQARLRKTVRAPSA